MGSPTNDVSMSAYDEVKWNLSGIIYRGLQAIDENNDLEAVREEQIFQIVERPREMKMGDYAFPCFRFAKPLKQKPPEIAKNLAAAIMKDDSGLVASTEVVGAFLNIRLKPGVVAKKLFSGIADGSYFKRLENYWLQEKQKVMVEYSQPNTHKVFHVGHMRNVALGDSIGRIYEYCGFDVIFANYIGDEGAHIAKCIWCIQKSGETVPEENKGEWLGRMYSKACIMIEDASKEERVKINEEVSEILRAIESKKGPTYEFWKESRSWSLKDFDEVYNWTGARFDHVFYESEVSEESQLIVDEFLEKDVFVKDDGAIGIDLKDDKLGFLIVRKRDGNTTYGTKDLALARRKFQEYEIDRSIYVVASEQNLHFKQVFKTLQKMGFEKAANCFHLSYGMVVLPDGKMSSRKGSVIEFKQMKSELGKALDEQLEKYRGDWSDEEIQSTAHKLAVGAIRYGMICSDPVKDIVFDLNDWLSFEGDTGPYLMYTFARTQSILAKAKEQNLTFTPDSCDALEAQEEVDLLRLIGDFNVAVLQSCENNKPSILAHHLFDTCKAFNRFIANRSVLKADTDEERSARLAMLESFAKVLENGLNLMGIQPPERM